MAKTYKTYLKLDKLLDLQKPISPEEHDEILFIIIHQVFELWFKQIIHELENALQPAFVNGDELKISLTFKRLIRILNIIVEQLKILETMTPINFLEFRDRLETASGFQSCQFRKLEFLLGNQKGFS